MFYTPGKAGPALAVLCVAILVCAPCASADVDVVIDPGHGGDNPGCPIPAHDDYR